MALPTATWRGESPSGQRELDEAPRESRAATTLMENCKCLKRTFLGYQQMQRLFVSLGRKENTFGSSAAQATCKRFLPVSEQTWKGGLILETHTMPLLLSSISPPPGSCSPSSFQECFPLSLSSADLTHFQGYLQTRNMQQRIFTYGSKEGEHMSLSDRSFWTL